MGRPPQHPRGNPWEPIGNETVLAFLSSHREGEVFSFGSNFPGLRESSHRICLSFGQQNISLDQSFLHHFISFQFMIKCNRQGKKCLPGTMVDEVE